MVCSVAHRHKDHIGLASHMVIGVVRFLRGDIVNTGISFALLAVGLMLFVWGFSVAESFSSDVSRIFTGSPTDKSVWLMVGGAGLAIVGLFGLTRRP